jgi:hypothetical protein
MAVGDCGVGPLYRRILHGMDLPKACSIPAPITFLPWPRKFSEGKGKSPRQDMKLQSMKNGDTRLPRLSLGKQAGGRESQKHSSVIATGWMKLRLVIFFVMFVPLAGWPQDDDEYLPVNVLKGATLMQPEKKPLYRTVLESFWIG